MARWDYFERFRDRWHYRRRTGDAFPQTLTATSSAVTVSIPTASLLAGVAALAAAACAITVSIPNAAPQTTVTRAATAPIVVVSSPAAALQPGVRSLSVTAPTVIVSAQSASVTAGAVTRSSTAPVVNVSAPAATVQPGGITRSASACLVTISTPTGRLILVLPPALFAADVWQRRAVDLDVLLRALPDRVAIDVEQLRVWAVDVALREDDADDAADSTLALEVAGPTDIELDVQRLPSAEEN